MITAPCWLHRTETDSIYGSRHLASQWAASGNIKNIALFMLLDLIGAEQVHFVSGFAETHADFKRLRSIERDLRKSGSIPYRSQSFFQAGDPQPLRIEDDHVPFMKRGVPILHLISVPFPPTWHTPMDDADHLHRPTIDALLSIFSRYLALKFIQ